MLLCEVDKEMYSLFMVGSAEAGGGSTVLLLSVREQQLLKSSSSDTRQWEKTTTTVMHVLHVLCIYIEWAGLICTKQGDCACFRLFRTTGNPMADEQGIEDHCWFLRFITRQEATRYKREANSSSAVHS